MRGLSYPTSAPALALCFTDSEEPAIHQYINKHNINK